MKLGSMKAPWGDQVKGSWWKALLIVIVYFVLRVMFESWMYAQGALKVTAEPTLDMLQDPEFLGQVFQVTQVESVVGGILLTLFVIGVSYKVGFRFFQFKTMNWKNILQALGIYLGFFALQIAWGALVTQIAPEYTQPDNQTLVQEMVGNMNLIYAFITVVIIAPIVEEYLLRGLILKYFFTYTPALGFIVSSIIFALLHSPANWIDFTTYFILSACLAGVYWYSRRLEYSIFLHMVQNLIGFLTIISMS